MKNITVTISDEVYRGARVRAAELDTSVSALVAEYLRSLTGREAELARLAARRQEIVKGIKQFSASDRLSRDEVHDRDALR